MVTESAPLTATARAIEGAFGIPAGRIRAMAAEGKVSHDGGRPAQYNVAEVLAERDRRNSLMEGWANSRGAPKSGATTL